MPIGIGDVLPHKPKPNIFNGITQAAGILENSRADSQLNVFANRTRGSGKSWNYGRNYDNLDYPHASVDFFTDTIVTLHGSGKEYITRQDTEKMNKTFSWFLATARRRAPRKLHGK